MGKASCDPRSQFISLAPGESEITLSPAQSPIRALLISSCPQIYFSTRPLRIGYCESDGYSQPSPSMARAVRLTCRLLQDAGHEVGLFSPGEGGWSLGRSWTGPFLKRKEIIFES